VTKLLFILYKKSDLGEVAKPII